MSKNKLSGFTTAELKSVHEDSFGNDYNIKEAFGLNKTEYRNNGADGTRKRPTRRQAKKDLEKTFGVYENKEADNWRKVRESMGIKDVNSNSDFAAMKREVSMEFDRRSNEKATAGLRNRLTELENRPAPEAKPEAPEKKGPKSYMPEDPNRPRPPSSPEDKIGGTPEFDASKYDWAKRAGRQQKHQVKLSTPKPKRRHKRINRLNTALKVVAMVTSLNLEQTSTAM